MKIIHKSKEYTAWKAIKARCTNPNNPRYKNYGARGIKRCERWDSFENFLNDMGLAPSPHHSIERIDNDADYTPPNCKWATNKDQANNRTTNLKITLDHQTKTLKEWCEEFGLKYNTILLRVSKLGWAPEKALHNAIKARRVAEYNGVEKPLKQWCADLGLNYTLTWQRIYRDGWPIQRAFSVDKNHEKEAVCA